MGRNSARMVQMLEQNPSVCEFFVGVLDHMVAYADEQGVAFSQVKVDPKAYIANDVYIRGKLVVER